MRPWQIVDTDKGAVIVPTIKLQCPFCKTEMLLHQFTALYYPKKDFYHSDVHLKCPHCGYFTTFGVPISREEFYKLTHSPLIGVVLTEELLTFDLPKEDAEKIKERLEGWGYW